MIEGMADINNLINNEYISLAYNLAMNSGCLRRKYGAVIVKNNQIVGTGYNNAPIGIITCSERGYCVREDLGIGQGKSYELCRAVHAEMNAIMNAGRLNCIGSELFLVGIDSNTKGIISALPCEICKKIIIQAGLYSINCLNSKGEICRIDVKSISV